MHIKSLFKTLLLVGSLFGLFFIHSYASGPTKTITQGQSATISWAVTGATSCTGGFLGGVNAVTIGNNVYNTWNGTSTPSTGSLSIGPFNVAGTFTFVCDAVSTSDQATVTVNPGVCANGATNFSACNVCPAGNYYSAGVCGTCPAGTTLTPNTQTGSCLCNNLANNPWSAPACTTCPVNQEFGSNGKCAYPAITGTSTVSNCTVSAEQSSCTTSVSWSTTGLTNANISTCTKNTVDWNCVSAVDTYTGKTGTQTLTLSGNPALDRVVNVNGTDPSTGNERPAVNQKIIRGNCATYSFWDGTKCTRGTHTLTLSPNTTSIVGTYACNNPNSTSASISRSPAGTGTSYTLPSISGSFTDTKSLTDGTSYTYTLSCFATGLATPLGTATASATFSSPKCTNGATNFSACNTCASGQFWSANKCNACPAGTTLTPNNQTSGSCTCDNLATNPFDTPGCTQCPTDYYFRSSDNQCVYFVLNPSITGADCTVSVNKSTCNSTVKWKPVGLATTPTPSLSTCTKPVDDPNCTSAVTTYTGASGSKAITLSGDPDVENILNVNGANPITKTYQYGLEQKTIRGNCAVNTTWDGTKCSYGVATLTATSTSSTSNTGVYDCTDTAAQSVKISRSLTSAPIVYTSSNISGTFSETTGIRANTTYTYTLSCYAGANQTGKVLVKVTSVTKTPAGCANGATNYSACNTCASGQFWSANKCNACPAGTTLTPNNQTSGSCTCDNLANNPWSAPSCTTCPVNQEFGSNGKCGYPNMTGDVTANDCVILSGQSSCTTPVSWTTTGLTSPNISTCKKGARNFTCVSPVDTYTGTTGTRNLTLTGDPAFNTVVNVNGTNPATSQIVSAINQKILQGTCESGAFWSGSMCTFGNHTLTASPLTATSISVNYGTDNPNAQSVVYSRNPGVPPQTSPVVSASAVDTTAITGGTTYTYTVSWYTGTNGDGVLLGSRTATVTAITVPPTATLGGTCGNGATDFPDCGTCPAGKVFDGVRCSNIGAGTMCTGNITNSPSGLTGVSPSAVCGNGIQEAGEECDGTDNVKYPSKQKCSSSCTLSCLDTANQDKIGCGGVDAINVNTVCKNGAKDSSAPTCNVCPTGQYFTGNANDGTGKCVTPVCGNNQQEMGESCDGTSGVPNGSKCTTGCCIVSTPPASCYPAFSLTCNNASSYRITNSSGTVITNGAYSAPVPWTPTTAGTYNFTCINGTETTTQSQVVTGSCDATKSTASMTLSANPKTIKSGDSVVLNWKATNPNSLCKVVAVQVPTTTCTSVGGVKTNLKALCEASRQNEANRITSLLSHGRTDPNDPSGGGRTMTSALTSGGTSATGKKSIQLQYSTTFIGSCGLNPLTDPNASKVQVNVANNIEG